MVGVSEAVARSEFELIADLFRPLAAGVKGAFELSDDAATISVANGRELVATADAMVEGVHFLSNDPPETVGRKLLAVNYSDLAAMGAEPLGATLTCALPARRDDVWIEGFAAGLGQAFSNWGGSLFGGDMTRTTGPRCFSLTAFGMVPKAKKGGVLRRNGARSGDLVVVSGVIGDGALGLLAAQGGLQTLNAADLAYLVDRYRCPIPRLDLLAWARANATSCIDVSDGLPQDAAKIAVASGVVLSLEAAAVPMSPVVRRWFADPSATWDTVLSGGDDYELLMTVPPGSSIPDGVTLIGGARSPEPRGPRVDVRDKRGVPLTLMSLGYSHF